MAKLSSRGRTAVAELSREYNEEQLQRQSDKMWVGTELAGKPSLTTWERRTRRVMSDGTVLEKHDCLFRPSSWETSGRRHSYGWKVHGKLKDGKTAADYCAIYRRPRKDGSPSPWTVTEGRTAPTVVISQKRIQRAIESGESIGFCLSCGAEAYGVEPDAHGYTCESCGKPEVSGAEELALASL